MTSLQKILFALTAVCSVILSLPQLYSQKQPKDIVFSVVVKVHEEPNPEIEFRWQSLPYLKTIEIYRKRSDQAEWGNPIATPDTGLRVYIDKNAAAGILYDYEFLGICEYITQYNHNDRLRDTLIRYGATGYVSTGIGVAPLRNGRPKALMIVDEQVLPHLADEIQQWRENLHNEGWTSSILSVPRSESYDKDHVQTTKKTIAEAWNSDKEHVSSVFLVGRVAVPYSGLMTPDGHTLTAQGGDTSTTHTGAWVADVYYGVMDESTWTDETVNHVAAGRPENRNIPGDGKFDQNQLLSEAILAVGRIDFYDMPLFWDKTLHDNMFDSEIELLKRYFEKNNRFRSGSFQPKSRAIVDDNFGAYGGYFAANAWRNYSQLVDDTNIVVGKWRNISEQESWLFGYGCGPGSYIGAGGVANSPEFVAKQWNIAFTMLFGSYFGDWDSRDNVMRSLLAAQGSTLTCSWTGRPPWFYQHVGFGQSIGYSTLISQNVNNGYKHLLVFGNDGTRLNYYPFYRYTHTSLLGDPTLTPYDIRGKIPEKPINLEVQNFSSHSRLTWEAQGEHDGFLLYRSENNAPAKLISAIPTTELHFNDSTTKNSALRYAVQAVALRRTRNGTLYIGSDTAEIINNISSIDNNNIGGNRNTLYSEIICRPNPASDMIVIENIPIASNYSQIPIHLCNAAGDIIDKRIAESATLSWDISELSRQQVSSGIYFIVIYRSPTEKTIRTIAIIR